MPVPVWQPLPGVAPSQLGESPLWLPEEQALLWVDIQPPPGEAFKDWRVATALEPARGEKRCARSHAFGLYRAANYDELIDHPVEMGHFDLARFVACGIAHEIALTGQHDCDMDRLCRDLKRVCEWQIRFFGEPVPMSRYVFLITVVGDAYGGLEHRASTALLCSRYDLPWPGMKGVSEGYRTLLGLCSHEYFHTWNVKRIKPAAFTTYDLNRENYTTLLWAFEGIDKGPAAIEGIIGIVIRVSGEDLALTLKHELAG